jgi:PadR family transcriptional regulator PadR
LPIFHNVEHNPPVTPTLGEFEQLVLIALVRLGPDAYGATIRREIETRASRALSISAVYTTLERLEQKGLVRSRIGEPTAQRGGRRRKHFELLPLGARALKVAYDGFTGMTAGVERRLKAL